MNILDRIVRCLGSTAECWALAACLMPAPAWGQGIIYDQMSLGREDSLSSVDVIPMSLPLGQVFVPRASVLDFVELSMGTGRLGNTQTLELLLRAGSGLNDPVIASTAPVTIVFNPLPHLPSVKTFAFPETVSLVPGAPYVFELVHLDGDYIGGVSFWNASIFDAYPEGGMFQNGKLGRADLWFKTGYVIPEPDTLTLFALGGALLLAARRKGCPPALGSDQSRRRARKVRAPCAALSLETCGFAKGAEGGFRATAVGSVDLRLTRFP